MALKPDRVELLTDVSYFMNNATASTIERGGVVSVVTSGSGVSMDDGNAVVSYSAVGQAALPVGILLNDVVNLDLTRQHINWNKDEVQGGGKVTLLRNGQVVTNKYISTGGTAISAGVPAYLAHLGNVAATGVVLITPYATGLAPRIGTFLSAPDADGYVKLSVNLQ